MNLLLLEESYLRRNGQRSSLPAHQQRTRTWLCLLLAPPPPVPRAAGHIQGRCCGLEKDTCTCGCGLRPAAPLFPLSLAHTLPSVLLCHLPSHITRGASMIVRDSTDPTSSWRRRKTSLRRRRKINSSSGNGLALGPFLSTCKPATTTSLLEDDRSAASALDSPSVSA